MELEIRIGREWTWFKDVKQLVLMTSSKLWNTSLPNILFQKTFLFTCFGKEKPYRAQHLNRKGMGLFWGPQKICYALRKPWNIFPHTGLLKSILCTDPAQQGKYHIDHRQTLNMWWRILVDGFEHFEETIRLIYFKHNCSEDSQAVHQKENRINGTEYS